MENVYASRFFAISIDVMLKAVYINFMSWKKKFKQNHVFWLNFSLFL